MAINRNYNRLSILIALLILNYSCSFCMAAESINDALAPSPDALAPSPGRGDDPYYPAVATWYGSPTGAGSGGACGLANDVALAPYSGYISAGNNNLFYYGQGCGACYEMYCTNNDNPACSGRPLRIAITDECPGSCNDDRIHFDLSGIAFGALAKPGQENNLRNAGRINLQYRRTRCNYGTNVKFRIADGSNKYYLAFAVENLNGYGDIGHIEILPNGYGNNWQATQRSYGVVYKYDVPEGTRGPYSIRITGSENSTSIAAYNVIPQDWSVGAFYYSNVNF